MYEGFRKVNEKDDGPCQKGLSSPEGRKERNPVDVYLWKYPCGWIFCGRVVVTMRLKTINKEIKDARG